MINDFDEAALEREGAGAAHAGQSWQSNPYLRRQNMPLATGETVQLWSRKHDAWQRGFEGQAAVELQTKEALPAEFIAAVVEHRLRGIPQVCMEIARNRYSVVRVELPRSHLRDENGRNWDVDGFVCGGLDSDGCSADFRAAVDAVRDRYDLAGARMR